MDGDNLSNQMVTFIKDSFNAIKNMEKENAYTQTETDILELGKMMHTMGKVY
jgi:hypothetical protein